MSEQAGFLPLPARNERVKVGKGGRPSVPSRCSLLSPALPSRRGICLARQALGCSADFQSAVSPNCIRQRVGTVPRHGISHAGRVQLCDTAQRGEAATIGARVCDPQKLCQPPSALTNPARRSLSRCCGSQSRAPQNRRALRRFREILIESNSALRQGAKHLLPQGKRGRGDNGKKRNTYVEEKMAEGREGQMRYDAMSSIPHGIEQEQ